MKSYIMAIVIGLICIFIGYKSAGPVRPVLLNKEVMRIGNELEQLTVNGFFCDSNRLKELTSSDHLKECFDYRRNLLRSNESLKIVLDNIYSINCSQEFVTQLLVMIQDLYSVTSSLIIYESQDINISFANPKLSSEMLKAAKLIRRVDVDNCLIKGKE